ncbi:MAG: transposase, partial [Chitinophagaceae bacterium]|nr:transposase [Chitinophagaceae bacterium]
MHLAALRWPTNKDLYCPHCGSMDKIYVFKDKITYKCSACLQKFNARTGTVYEGSKIPLQKWFVAIYLMTSHKKGISSIQLAKDIHVTQTTAWFMAHRIRHGASVKNWDNAFSKVVEIDETYIGSRLKNKHFLQRKAIDNYSSHLIKTIVFGMIERDGKVFAKVVPDVKQATIIPIIEKVVQ